MKKVLFVALSIMLIMPCRVFALRVEYGEKGTKVKTDNYQYAKSEWVTFDSDKDGMEEYHYFDSNGFMVVNGTTPDGYQVNDKGQWVVFGVVQKKNAKSNPYDNETNQNAVNVLIQPTETISIDTLSKEKEFEYNDNTESIENDPTTIPPKAKEAIKIIRYWCNEDGKTILPYPKKTIKLGLKGLGYKDDIINRAIAECGVDWNGHALIMARAIKSKHNTPKNNYNNGDIEKALSILGFNNTEIEYAIENLNTEYSRKYINPSDFQGLTQAECIIKLSSYGLKEDQIQQALTFVMEIE